MSFFKKLFGKPKNETPAAETKLPPIAAADNPWGIPLLDLRPLTQHVMSTSKDQRMAENAISYGGEDGTTFYGMEPADATTVNTHIVLPIDKALYPGVLFTPNTMEHKWAIYFDGEQLIFVRSWQREVVVKAKTRQQDNTLIVENITGYFTENENADFNKAVLNFLLISYCIDEIVPAPLPLKLEADSDKAGLWAFSAYGNKAHFGVFNDTFMPTATKPLRTHSLLHIAVARANIAAIEYHVNHGININSLAGDGLTALHWSVAPENLAPMEKLLALGANPNAVSFEGATAIMNVAQSGKIDKTDKVNLLIKHGANVNAQDKRGFTALHRAAEMGHTDVVILLLSNGANKDVEAGGHTPMSLAIAMNRADIVELLG